MNIIKHLESDLFENYTIEQILSLAEYNNLNISVKLGTLMRQISECNLRHVRLTTKHMLNGDDYSDLIFFIYNGFEDNEFVKYLIDRLDEFWELLEPYVKLAVKKITTYSDEDVRQIKRLRVRFLPVENTEMGGNNGTYAPTRGLIRLVVPTPNTENKDRIYWSRFVTFIYELSNAVYTKEFIDTITSGVNVAAKVTKVEYELSNPLRFKILEEGDKKYDNWRLDMFDRHKTTEAEQTIKNQKMMDMLN